MCNAITPIEAKPMAAAIKRGPAIKTGPLRSGWLQWGGAADHNDWSRAAALTNGFDHIQNGPNLMRGPHSDRAFVRATAPWKPTKIPATNRSSVTEEFIQNGATLNLTAR